MNTLLDQLSQHVGAAFMAAGLDYSFGTVRVSDRPDLAQFQCNGAMGAAKKIGKNPREVATQIVTHLQHNPVFARVEAVGPGFINLDINDTEIAGALHDMADDPHNGIPQTGNGTHVLLDYGGPNAAKPMHVAHLKSAIVGDTLRRLLLATGHHAIGDIHLGDWGLQAGMVISEIERRDPHWRTTSHTYTLDELNEIYPAASKASKEDPERMEESRRATLVLQQGDPDYNRLWNDIVTASKAAMKLNYAALNVHFDLWLGEKDVDPLIPDMVADLRARHFAVESDGAVVINVAKNDDKKEIPPLILLKSDGAYLYATTDLATIQSRMAMTPRPTWLIYVIDQRQGLHIEQVQRAARMAGLLPADVELDFAGFGTMNGTDGKPFKTRAGGVLKLEDLISQGIDKARARLNDGKMSTDIGEAEREDIARMVAVAAIKYADLKNPRHVDYIFDLDAMTSFEGKTGPYLLYQAVRIKSILTKLAAEKLFAPHGFQPQIDDNCRALALLLADFPNAVTASLDNLSAHILCDYLHRLAQEFSSFYGRCHILSESDMNKKLSWIHMCQMTLRTLEKGLDLLGINVPNRM